MATLAADTGTYKELKVFIGDIFAHFENTLATPKLFDSGFLKEVMSADSHGMKYYKGGTLNILIPPSRIDTFDKDVFSAGDVKRINFDEMSIGLNGYASAVVGENLMAFNRSITEAAWLNSATKVVARSLARRIDSFCLAYAKNNTYNQIGTPGTAMADTDLLKATTLLDNLGVPNEGRRLVINPNANYNLAIGLRTLSNPNAIPGAFQDKTFNTGNVPSNIFGVETVLVTPSLLYHLVGSHGGATLGVSAAPTEGATSIVLTRTGTSAISSFLRVGDIITFGTAGNANAVYKVNYETKDSFGDLAQFVVTADVDVALNATTVTVPVDPPFRATGDRQNISRMPTASNPVTPVTVAGASGSTYAVNLLTWRQAFIWCSPPQAIMKDRPNLQLSLPEIPFNVRGSYGSDHLGNSETYRYDTLYAVHGYRTEGAVRICGL